MADESAFYREIINYIKSENPDKKTLANKKISLCKTHKLKEIPTDIQILLNAPRDDYQAIRKIIQTKPGRTQSGVAVVAIMSDPFPCPHGTCLMCPSRTDEGVPQSYTGKEPATMRGMRNEFDSYLQVMNRLEQYIATGHDPEKVELIIMGGTFPSFEWAYQEAFVMYAFKAMNDFSKRFYDSDGDFDIESFKDFFELPGEIGSDERTQKIRKKLLELKCDTNTELRDEQEFNETAKIRCVGFTLETRPDYGKLEQGNMMLELGCTRVELGVQTVYDDALEAIGRKHSVQDSVDATRTLKDLCFKINYHVMPGLPGVNRKKDLEGLKKLFDDPDFRPDMLKIYPCMVMKNTKLFDMWKKGEFTPLDTENAANLIAEFKKHVPEYVRIMRVQRDIPTFMIEAGVDRTNLRQYIEKLNPGCRCIRCREVGHRYSKDNLLPKDVKTIVRAYDASYGKEYFISIEDHEQDILLGFTRLRFPSQQLRKEITETTALIRELHVYGDVARIGDGIPDDIAENGSAQAQHKGHGRKLIERAEKIAKEHGKDKMAIISGIGVREYYKKLGYCLEGPYMVKKLS